MRRLQIGIACVLLLAAPAEGSASEVDAEAVKMTRSFLAGLAGDIKGAVDGVDGGRERLLQRGRLKASLGREIDRMNELVRQAGDPEAVRFATFVIHATVWFGVLPLKEIELHMIMAADKVRLLRTAVRDTRRRVFGRPSATEWRGEGATAIGQITTQMVRAMTDGKCDALPRIGPEDHEAFLPPKGKARTHTLDVFGRFDKTIQRHCETLHKTPNHRVTWRFGELGGSIVTLGAKPVPFKLTMAADPEGAPQITHLRAIPPRKR